MEIGNVSNLSFVRNAVINCSNESTGQLFNFLANKSTANIKINDNFFYKNVGSARGGALRIIEQATQPQKTPTRSSETHLTCQISCRGSRRGEQMSFHRMQIDSPVQPHLVHLKNGVSVTRVQSAPGLPTGKTDGHLSVVKNQLTTGEVDLSVRMEFVEDATGEIWSKTAISDTAWSEWRQIC